MNSSQINKLLHNTEQRLQIAVELIETHISWILLTGELAYKIKKPVNYGFLDFSNLEKRHFYCQEELRLNSRFSNELYLELATIIKQDGLIVISEKPVQESDPSVEIIEYAVKMRQFDRSRELDKEHQRTPLAHPCCDELGMRLAESHVRAEISDSMDERYGLPEAVWAPIEANFEHLNRKIEEEEIQPRLDHLKEWSKQQHEQLQAVELTRKQEGFVKECHGDLHLGNITRIDDRITFFDCIEFKPSYRWIDTMSELAFLLMDLESRGGYRQAHWVLDSYLVHSGDYEGLRLLNFYKVYRALVRAKVAELSWSSAKNSATGNGYLVDFHHYIELAESYTQSTKPMLVLMQGISGSGKSTVARDLAERVDAIHLRSDVERKRLFGLKLNESSAEKRQDIYSDEANDRVFEYLLSLTKTLLQAGLRVIVDATFILQARRQPFLDWAKQKGIGSAVVFCSVSLEQAEQWINERQKEGADPSEATINIAKRQLQQYQPVTNEECDDIYRLDPSKGEDRESDLRAVGEALLRR